MITALWCFIGFTLTAIAATSAYADETEPKISNVVEVRENVIRVGDIAAGTRYRNLIVASLPDGSKFVDMDAQQRQTLLRRRIPGVPLDLKHQGMIRIVASASGGEERNNVGTCQITNVGLSEGDFVSANDVQLGPCSGGMTHRWLAFDVAAMAPYARFDIPSGTNIGRGRLPQIAPLPAGHEVVYRTSEGVVVIERKVNTLQAARPDHKVFVKTEEGTVLVSKLVHNQAKADLKSGGKNPAQQRSTP